MDHTAATEAAAEPVITDNQAESRLEIYVGGERAGLVQYHVPDRDAGVISFMHTEVDDRFQGMGLAGKLARAALDSARERGLQVLPYCPYIKSWIAKHPDYVDLVPEDKRAEFNL
jgi:predicted GNAT family acetyltransferase